MLLDFQAWFSVRRWCPPGWPKSLPSSISLLPETTLDSAETNPTRASRAATILVVEDDRSIRVLFTHVLRGHGYDVIACEDGAHALEAARLNLNRIDAVITDSSMPGLDGRELILGLRALSPHIPILVVSGSVDSGSAKAGDRPGIVRLSKPISPAQLVRELRQLLCDRMKSLADDDFREMQ